MSETKMQHEELSETELDRISAGSGNSDAKTQEEQSQQKTQNGSADQIAQIQAALKSVEDQMSKLQKDISSPGLGIMHKTP